MPNRLALSPQSKKYKAMRLLSAVEGVLRSRATPESLKNIRNFLCLQMDAPLGSVIHATPLYEALKRAIPDAHISVVASELAANVLENIPWIDRCTLVPDPSKNFWAAAGAVRQLYQNLPKGPVCIVTTTGNQRPVQAIIAMLAGPAARVGYTLALPLYDVALDFQADRPQIKNNLEIVRALGYETSEPEPKIFFTDADLADARRLLKETPQERPRLAVVTQCSRNQPKSWSAERFREGIAGLQNAVELTPIFLGTESESAAIDELRRTLDTPGISLAGRTTVSQLAAVLAQCDWILGLDTGTFHVARAVGLPGVVLAPAWQNPVEWLPVNHPNYAILCGPSISMPGVEYQMDETTVEQVMQATLAMMEKFPASLAARAQRLHASQRKKV